jgi:hypothetical protein
MTNEEIDALQPGPELDMLVAKDVMKWIGFYVAAEARCAHGIPPAAKAFEVNGICIPPYSTSDATALEVLKKIGLARRCNLHVGLRPYVDVIFFDPYEVLPQVLARADTVALAICRAALKAVNK